MAGPERESRASRLPTVPTSGTKQRAEIQTDIALGLLAALHRIGNVSCMKEDARPA